MPILYRTDKTTVTAVECQQPSWPHLDADGQAIYFNTHFTDEAAAWQQVLSEAEAAMNNALDRVARLQHELQQAEQAALQRAAEYKAAKIQFAAWQEQQNDGH